EQAFEARLSNGVTYREIAQLNRASGRFDARRECCWGKLVLSSEPLANTDPLLIENALLEYVHQQGLGVLAWSDQARQWQARALFCAPFADIDAWPDFSDAGLESSLADWLRPFLQGCKSVADLKKIDLLGVLRARLDWTQQQWMARMAPEILTVPTGRDVTIDYSADQPVLAIKLQEMFGCPTSPTVAEGRVKVVLHLLSPAQRTLAVTSDLTSFWQNAYQEIKKDMKGRYPKHYWPDDPLQALPTQFTKARMSKQD
ncbi:MAG: ATP-dependent helicase HrpB, partial [Pseudomonadota bacterium]